MRGTKLNRAVALSLSAACCALAAVSAGCGGQEVKAKARGSSQAETAVASPQNAWNWDSYPRLQNMRLGILTCQLQPKSVIPVQSPLAGTLRVYVTFPQTNLGANTMWAEFEPEIFAAEEQSLREAERKLNDFEKLQNEIEIPRKRMQLERQIEDAQRQVAMLRLLSTNKELADLAFNFSGTGTTPLRPDSLHKSELELRLLSQSMAYLESTNVTAIGVDLTGQRTEFERRKLEFERRRAQSRLRMPFDGKLTVNLPLTEGVTEYPVTAGQELAVARDLSSIRVRVPISSLTWMSIPPERLSAMIRLATGETVHAPFSYQKIERVQSREESIYYFQIPDAKASTVAKLIGTDLSCEVWANLEETVRVVPKMAVVMHRPEGLQGRNWAHAISTVFPGARLVVEGQTELGVVPPPGVVQMSSAK